MASSMRAGCHGSRTLCALTVALLGLGLPLVAFADGFVWLCLAFLFYGAATGALDVSMNAQGIAVERAYRRPIMSSFHGMFSIGAMAGAGATGLLAGQGGGIGGQVLAIRALSIVLGPH